MLLDGAIKKAEDFEPELGPFDFYLEAFHEIGTARSSGLGLTPIPFTAIAEYCNLFQIPDFEEFNSLIRRMDRVFLDLHAASQKESTKAKGKGKNKSGGNTS